MAILMRTALFVPGNRPDRIEKALNTKADMVIIDLEDAVPLSEKAIARLNVREKVSQFADRAIMVRINPLRSSYIQSDLEEAVVKGVKGIMLPKVEQAEDIREINRLLLEIEKRDSLPEGFFLVLPLIESGSAVQRIYEIVSTETKPQRVYTVAFGAADFTLDMGIEMTLEGSELLYARSRISIACRAAGLAPPIDTPFMLDLSDIDALVSDAKRAKRLGFQGKLVIHPRQIDPCNEVFSPSLEEIEKAEKIVRAFEQAEASGTAAIQLEGKFIDYPVVERSRDLLALANEINRKRG